MPTNTAEMTRSWTSRLRMWVSSWASTASSSASSRLSISPRVTVTEYCFSRMPLAKAFRCGVSITRSAGMVMPRLMQRFSSRFHSRGSALRSTRRAPVIASMMPWLANQAITHQTAVTASTTG